MKAEEVGLTKRLFVLAFSGYFFPSSFREVKNREDFFFPLLFLKQTSKNGGGRVNHGYMLTGLPNSTTVMYTRRGGLK